MANSTAVAGPGWRDVCGDQPPDGGWRAVNRDHVEPPWRVQPVLLLQAPAERPVLGEGTACPCCCRHRRAASSPSLAPSAALPRGPKPCVLPHPRGAVGSWPNCTTGGNTVRFTVCASDHMAAPLALALPYSKVPLTPPRPPNGIYLGCP